MINGLKSKCFGKITRRRITKKVREESIIDFVIGCEDMVEMIESLKIDEDKKYSLTSYKKTKNGIKIQESDHNTLITTLNAKWSKKIAVKRYEMYNLKDQEGLIKFKEMTSKNDFLSEVFNDEDKNIEIKTKQFLKRLKYCVSKSFKKIRLTKSMQN